MARQQIIESTVAGIPCQVQIDHFVSVKGDSSTWASDWDFYGYTEIEFTVCDRRGRAAPWLTNKLTADDKARIEQEIEEFMGVPA